MTPGEWFIVSVFCIGIVIICFNWTAFKKWITTPHDPEMF